MAKRQQQFFVKRKKGDHTFTVRVASSAEAVTDDRVEAHGMEIGPKGWCGIVSAEIADALKDRDDVEVRPATEDDVLVVAKHDRKDLDARDEHIAAVAEAGTIEAPGLDGASGIETGETGAKPHHRS